MKRWTKILLAVVAIIVIAVVSIPLFVNANTFRPVIEKQLSAALGRTVTTGDLRLPFLSGSLVAQDLSVSDDPAFSPAPFLTGKELRIGVALTPLIFAHKLDIRSFQIQSPQINVIRAANGTWNFSSLGKAASAPATSAPAGGPPSPLKVTPAELADLYVGHILINDGRVTVATLPARGPASVYEHVDITAQDFSFRSQFPFQVAMSLPAGGTLNVDGHFGPLNRDNAASSPGEVQITVKGLNPVASGFLNPGAGMAFVADMDMHAKSDGQTLTTNGTIHLQNLRLRKGAATTATHPVDLGYNGTHQLKENSGAIQNAVIKIGNSAIHVTGTYQPASNGADDPQLKLKIDGQQLPMDDLQSLMTAAGVRLPNGSKLQGGTAALNLAVDGQPQALAIAGALALDNTKLVGFDIGSKIHGIAALSGIKTGDTTEFEKLRVNVHITNAGVTARDIDAIIPAMGDLTGAGTVSAENQLDFHLIAKVASAGGIGKVGVGLISKLNGTGDSSGVPLKITGTPDEPYITADVGSVVGKKTKSIVSIFGGKKK
jgi:AsmA protein